MNNQNKQSSSSESLKYRVDSLREIAKRYSNQS